jgi:hypothetical protein
MANASALVSAVTEAADRAGIDVGEARVLHDGSSVLLALGERGPVARVGPHVSGDKVISFAGDN